MAISAFLAAKSAQTAVQFSASRRPSHGRASQTVPRVSPPLKDGRFRNPRSRELVSAIAPSILDIRTHLDDFLGHPRYTQARAFLQTPGAESLLGGGLARPQNPGARACLLARRPIALVRNPKFRDATPPEKQDLVADPAQGSRHNSTAAPSIYPLRFDQATSLRDAGT